MAPFGLPEFHLLDREVPPATSWAAGGQDRQPAPQLPGLPDAKRALENYLHPLAVQAVSSLD